MPTVHPLSRQIGDAVRRWRTRIGMSQETLSFDAGLHRTFVSRLERDLVNPSLDTVDAIARALGGDAVELVAHAQEARERALDWENGARQATESRRTRRRDTGNSRGHVRQLWLPGIAATDAAARHGRSPRPGHQEDLEGAGSPGRRA